MHTKYWREREGGEGEGEKGGRRGGRGEGEERRRRRRGGEKKPAGFHHQKNLGGGGGKLSCYYLKGVIKIELNLIALISCKCTCNSNAVV